MMRGQENVDIRNFSLILLENLVPRVIIAITGKDDLPEPPRLFANAKQKHVREVIVVTRLVCVFDQLLAGRKNLNAVFVKVQTTVSVVISQSGSTTDVSSP